MKRKKKERGREERKREESLPNNRNSLSSLFFVYQTHSNSVFGFVFFSRFLFYPFSRYVSSSNHHFSLQKLNPGFLLFLISSIINGHSLIFTTSSFTTLLSKHSIGRLRNHTHIAILLILASTSLIHCSHFRTSRYRSKSVSKDDKSK